MTDDMPISYEAAARGTPVLSSAGTEIGTLEHVLEVPEVDVFDGIVIATKAGLRFIDAETVPCRLYSNSRRASRPGRPGMSGRIRVFAWPPVFSSMLISTVPGGGSR
jgi:hypothetical protein